MAHARATGTAWDIEREDYAYTCNLDLTGWAWEFLRRDGRYRAACENCQHVPLHSRLHDSGAHIYQASAHDTAPRSWGLLQFSDPDTSALDLDLFWRPDCITHVARCQAQPAFGVETDTVSLRMFTARCGVLLADGRELVAVRGRKNFACLEIVEGSILQGEVTLTFIHEGFESAARHHETLGKLRHMMRPQGNTAQDSQMPPCKYLHYLMALDGHLAGASYRQIAQALYGKDSVGAYWTDDTRGLKSKVRRAVAQGLALMSGGYRDLL